MNQFYWQDETEIVVTPLETGGFFVKVITPEGHVNYEGLAPETAITAEQVLEWVRRRA